MLEVGAYAVSLGPPVFLSVSAAWSDFEVLQTWPKGLEQLCGPFIFCHPCHALSHKFLRFQKSF